MCACDDTAQEAMLAKGAVMNQQELDARNSSERPLTFEEVVAKLFNDEEFLPCTESLPNLSSTFADPIDLPFSLMPDPITADQVKSKLSDAHVKLMKIINWWEQSGNGFSQIRDEQEETSDEDGDSDDDADEAPAFGTEANVRENFGHMIDKR